MNIEYLDAVVYIDNERRFQTTLYQKEVGHQSFLFEKSDHSLSVFSKGTPH